MALEVRQDELLDSVIHEFMLAAQKLGSSFKILKVLGLIDLGNTQLIRFETDCGRNYAKGAAEALSRSYVVPTASGTYEGVRGDWRGTVPSMRMQTPPLPTFAHKVYRGPGAPFWDRQFIGS